MSRSMRVLYAFAFIAMSSVGLSCDVNDYCINCGAIGDGGGGNGDAGDGDAIDADPNSDATDASNCVPSGPEVCDNKDNNCNGLVDEGTLPMVGDPCDNVVGECAGGVKQCTMGVITCSKPPMGESCDNKDNDCDGVVDDGNPGGGAKCGTDQGECVAGTLTCVSGSVQCVGAIGGSMAPFGTAETCNGKDDDCNGVVDNNPTGIPPTFCDANNDVGECNKGTPTCVGGGITCVGVVGPSPELCDTAGLDQDCNGQPNNGFDLQNDPTNCGACGMKCMFPNALEGCSSGQCTIAACEDGYHNNNGMTSDGCEFGPCTIQGNEVCNGVDDDCDGLVDSMDPSMQTPSVASLCRTANECSTAQVVCTGANGFRCEYPDPDVEDTNGVNGAETLCDAKDNDCDGVFDEGQPGLGNSCTLGQGECQTQGMLVCPTANPPVGPAVCNAAPPGAGTPEVCDGRDNNCNGIVDDGAATGTLPGQDWVNIPGTTAEIMKFEASHPDATTTGGGTITSHVCSRQNVLPWTNISYPEAVNACSSIGARLCSEAEWQRMCVPPVTYPVTGPATSGTSDFTFIEAEDVETNATVGGRTWAAIAPLNFNGVTAMQVPNNGDIVRPATSAQAGSARMDYRLNLAAATNYTVWTRMRSPAATTALRDATRGTQTLAPVSASTTQVGDLVIVTTWTVAGNGIPTHTTQAGFTQIVSLAHDDGSTDGRFSVAYRVATSAGAVAYQAYTSSGGTSYSGLTVLRAGSYDLNVLAAGVATSNTTNGSVPDPPLLANVNEPAIVLAIGAWHYGGFTATEATTPPLGFTPLWEMLGGHQAELAVATSETVNMNNPGAFADGLNVVNGTVGATIAIGRSNRSASAWVGLTQGNTFGAANARAIWTPADDQWHWVPSPVLATGAAGTYTFSIFMREDGLMVDTIAVARQSTDAPTFDNSWSYATNPRTPQPTTCNSDDLDTNGTLNGDQDDILATGALNACHVDKGADDAFDMSGNVKEWTLARSAGFNPIRGGASNNEVTGTTCKLDFSSGDNSFRFPNVGFRCCRD